VFGPGPIGQGVAMLAKQMGAADVAIVGRDDPVRFQTLRDLGFDQLYDMIDPEAPARLAEITGDGFDLAVDAAGVAVVVNQALRLLKSCGILAIAGLPEEPANLDVMLVVKNRLQIRGVSRIPPSAWATSIKVMAEDPEAFLPLITHRLPLSQAQQGFDLCHRRAASKVMLFPE
jgi:threonine 3-dehydrogenase